MSRRVLTYDEGCIVATTNEHCHNVVINDLTPGRVAMQEVESGDLSK